MNETRQITAILRKNDDSNGLLMVSGRILVASSLEGLEIIRDLARQAWPTDQLIEREFDAPINVEDRILPPVEERAGTHDHRDTD